MADKQKVLVLFAHPSQERSEVNIHLYNAVKDWEEVTAVNLYHEYPTYHIDIDKEQQRLVEHDVVIFLFPLYWYSTPSILKEWQDLVLEYGFAYGKEGNALSGKTFLCTVSAGGPEKAYCKDGYNNYPIRELLRPLEQTVSLCKMKYLPPFLLFGSRTAVEEGRLDQHIENWKQLIKALHEGRLDLEEAMSLSILNDGFHDVIAEGV